MNYELLWKMEVEDHLKTKEEIKELISIKNKRIDILSRRINDLEDELEALINKNNAERLTNNITIKCDTVEIYG